MGDAIDNQNAAAALDNGPASLDETMRRGPWRDGPYLVVRKSFKDFPDRCIVCNAPAHGQRMLFKCRYIRSPAGLVALGIVMPLILIFVLPLIPTARLRAGICRRHKTRDLRSRMPTWFLSFTALGMFALAWFVVFAYRREDAAALLSAFAYVCILGSIAYAGLRTRPLVAKKMDNHFVWLGKVSEEYVREYPALVAPPAKPRSMGVPPVAPA